MKLNRKRFEGSRPTNSSHGGFSYGFISGCPFEDRIGSPDGAVWLDLESCEGNARFFDRLFLIVIASQVTNQIVFHFTK